MNKNNNKGFTLIELLVVIAIIGILSSIVLASLNIARTRAIDAKILSEYGQLKIAFEIYNDENGEYPQPPTTSGSLNYFCIGSTNCIWEDDLLQVTLPLPNFIPDSKSPIVENSNKKFRGFIWLRSGTTGKIFISTNECIRAVTVGEWVLPSCN